MSNVSKLVPVLFLLASPAFAGWSMTQVTSTGGKGEGAPSATTQRISMEGSDAKIEWIASDFPMMESGSYLLVQDGGSKMFMVDPAKRTYARFDPMAMGAGVEAMEGSGVELTIEDPTMVKLLEEPGAEMLGRPTTHYRYRTTYTTVMTMPMGMKTATTMDIVEDLWTAPAIDLGGARPALAAMSGGGTRGELQRLEREVKATLVGLPLKQVTVTTSKSSSQGSGAMGMLMRRAGGGGGGDSTLTTTVVVQDLVAATLPASTFQIPAGYTETEILQRGPAMPDLGEGSQ